MWHWLSGCRPRPDLDTRAARALTLSDSLIVDLLDWRVNPFGTELSSNSLRVGGHDVVACPAVSARTRRDATTALLILLTSLAESRPPVKPCVNAPYLSLSFWCLAGLKVTGSAYTHAVLTGYRGCGGAGGFCGGRRGGRVGFGRGGAGAVLCRSQPSRF